MQQNEITYESIEDEGINYKFIQWIKQDLNKDYLMEIAKDINNKAFFENWRNFTKTKSELVENDLKYIIYFCSTRITILSIIKLFKFLMTPDLYDALKDIDLYLKKIILYLCKMRSINAKILKKIETDYYIPENIVEAYSHLITGIDMSFKTCETVLYYKLAIARNLIREDIFYNVIFPNKDNYIEKDYEIFEECYKLIKEKEKTLSKSRKTLVNF